MNMEKVEKYIWYVFVAFCTFLVVVVFHVCTNVEVDDTTERTVEKKELDEQLREHLYITGDTIQYTPDTVTITNMQIEENRLLIDLAYFNSYNRVNISLTMDEALEEYDNFCKGSGNYDRILALSEFDWKQEINGRGSMDYIEAYQYNPDYILDITEEIQRVEPDFIYNNFGIREIDRELLVQACETVLEQKR